MKNLIKTFGFDSLVKLAKEKNWRLPTLKEARRNKSEYDFFWISDIPPEPEDQETHALLYNRLEDKSELVNKNHRHNCCVIKMPNKEEIKRDKFIEDIFEIAFGDNAINRDFSYEDVIETLKEFSEKSWQYDQLNK